MDSKESPTSYEEIRRKRLEENKKRLEELGLNGLSQNLSKHLSPLSKSPSTRQIKPRTFKQKVTIELRRSSRVASNPAPDYREVEVEIPVGRRRARFEVLGGSRYYSRNMPRTYASHGARMEAADKAETVMKELDAKNPSFVKPMLQSHVSGGFWLGLPSFFCKTYLPLRDEMIVLEDENGEEWETVYLAHKTGLSGGWRGFSLDHGLEDGDALIFELVQYNRFKVHVVRANEYETKMEDEEKVDDSINKTAKKNEITEDTPNSKRKQILIKEEELEDGEELVKKVDQEKERVDGMKGSKRKLAVEMEETVQGRKEEDAQVSNDDCRKGKKEKLVTETKETIEGKKEEDARKGKKQKLLTGMLRSKKTQDVMIEGNKGKLPTNETIEVC